MAWALARMRRRPDKEWAAEFLKVTYHKVPSMGGWCLATLAWALAELALVPPPAWTYSFVNAARALMTTPAPSAGVKEEGGAVAARAAAGAAAMGVTAMDSDGEGWGAGEAGEAEGAGAAVGAGSMVGSLSVLDLGQVITALRTLNEKAQLSKVGAWGREGRGGREGGHVGDYLGRRVGSVLFVALAAQLFTVVMVLCPQA